MKIERYKELRAMLLERGYGKEIDWCESLVAPATAEDLWREYAWVVLNSGMKNQIAEKIWDKVRPVVERGESARTVFNHPGKSTAIDLGWRDREQRFESFNILVARPSPVREVLAWCELLPWIGKVTRYHLAKNLGVDVAKPDRWLERVAAESGERVQGLCERLAEQSGDRVATVDLVIWRACNLGIERPRTYFMHE